MLADFRQNLHGEMRRNLTLIEGDANYLPLENGLVDFVYSFTSLYHVPEVQFAIREAARLLRPGGIAALELGNLYSINTLVCNYHYRHSGWAKPYHVPYSKLHGFLLDAGFEVIRQHSFQLLNCYGVPGRMIYLFPLTTSLWKPLLAKKVYGKILDEWLSSLWFTRYFAFRHMFICRRRA